MISLCNIDNIDRKSRALAHTTIITRWMNLIKPISGPSYVKAEVSGRGRGRSLKVLGRGTGELESMAISLGSGQKKSNRKAEGFPDFISQVESAQLSLAALERQRSLTTASPFESLSEMESGSNSKRRKTSSIDGSVTKEKRIRKSIDGEDLGDAGEDFIDAGGGGSSGDVHVNIIHPLNLMS